MAPSRLWILHSNEKSGGNPVWCGSLHACRILNWHIFFTWQIFSCPDFTPVWNWIGWVPKLFFQDWELSVFLLKNFLISWIRFPPEYLNQRLNWHWRNDKRKNNLALMPLSLRLHLRLHPRRPSCTSNQIPRTSSRNQKKCRYIIGGKMQTGSAFKHC